MFNLKGLMAPAGGDPNQGGMARGMKLLNDPAFALPVAAALISGKDNRQAFGQGLGMAGMAAGKIDERDKAEAQKNRSEAWLQQYHPEVFAQYEAGMPMQIAMQRATAQPAARKIIKGADGYNYYEDGTRVLPGVERKADSPLVSVNMPGPKEVDKDYAPELNKWRLGGAANTQRNLAQLSDVLTQLKTKNVTGPLIGSLPDAVLSVTNPDAIDAREKVEQVVQLSLKEVLGAQFTEKEGAQLIKRAYNPVLSEEQNAQRLEALIRQIQLAAQAKDSAARYFAQYKTLDGWEGRLPTMEDFDMFSDSPATDPARTTSGGIKWSIEE